MARRVPLPHELRLVPHSVLEEYVRSRLTEFSKAFASCLSPNTPQPLVEAAFNNAMRLSGAGGSGEESSELDDCVLRFHHLCRFTGCSNPTCALCKNNPNKRCQPGDNLDECYADCQVLRSKCEAEVFVELLNTQTQAPVPLPGLEVQVSVIDGDSWNETQPNNTHRIRELLKSDQGQTLLACSSPGHRVHPSGRIVLKLANGRVRLPDVSVTDKNDTFHLMGNSYSSFRLMARVVKRDLYDNATVVDSIPPAITGRFIVKTQRAISDYRKCEYPHYKDELTKLKFVGSITAQRLRDIKTQMGWGDDAPFSSISTVEQMKHLILFADQNRQVENKLLDLLNMKGKHKHKWDYLRNLLLERVVYDDQTHRAWYADENRGLVYVCKQAQVNLDKPLGLFQRVNQGMQSALQVFTQPEGGAAETLKAWKVAAEQAWIAPGHPGWTMVHECMEIIGPSSSSSSFASGPMMANGFPRPSPTGGMASPASPTASTQRPQRSGHRSRRNSTSAPQVKEENMSSEGGMPREDVHNMTMRQVLQMQEQRQQPAIMLLPQCVQPGMFQSRSAHLPAPFMMDNASQGMPSMAPLAPNMPVHGMSSTADSFQLFMPGGSSTLPPISTMGGGSIHRNAQQGDVTMSETSLESKLSAPASGSAPRPFLGHFDVALTGSGRLRRMSADAVGTGLAAQEPLPVQPASAGLSDLGKRSRTSAPEGLTCLSGKGDEVDSTFDASRMTFYHNDSHGRHLPRTRTTEGRTSPCTSPVNSQHAGYENDLDGMDQVFSSVLEGMNDPALLTSNAQYSHQPPLQGMSPSVYGTSLPTQPACTSTAFSPGSIPLHPPPQPEQSQPHQGQHQHHRQYLRPPRSPRRQQQQQQLPQHAQPHASLGAHAQPALSQDAFPQHAQQQGLPNFWQLPFGAQPLGAEQQPPMVAPASPHDSSGTDNPGTQRTMSQDLRRSMRRNLTLMDDSATTQEPEQDQSNSERGSASIAAAAAAAEAAVSQGECMDSMGETPARVLHHSDSDSFSRGINRVLRQSESDSFRSLLQTLQLPTGAPPTDADFDELLLKNLPPTN